MVNLFYAGRDLPLMAGSPVYDYGTFSFESKTQVLERAKEF